VDVDAEDVPEVAEELIPDPERVTLERVAERVRELDNVGLPGDPDDVVGLAIDEALQRTTVAVAAGVAVGQRVTRVERVWPDVDRVRVGRRGTVVAVVDVADLTLRCGRVEQQDAGGARAHVRGDAAVYLGGDVGGGELERDPEPDGAVVVVARRGRGRG